MFAYKGLHLYNKFGNVSVIFLSIRNNDGLTYIVASSGTDHFDREGSPHLSYFEGNDMSIALNRYDLFFKNCKLEHLLNQSFERNIQRRIEPSEFEDNNPKTSKLLMADLHEYTNENHKEKIIQALTRAMTKYSAYENWGAWA